MGGRPPWQFWVLHAFLLTAYLGGGHKQQAEQIIDQLLARPDELNPWAKSGFLYLLGHACWLSGRLPEMKNIFQQVRSMVFPTSSVITHQIMALFLGIIELAEGHYPAARRTLQEAVTLETRMSVFNLFGSARILLAHLYLKMGLPEKALAEAAAAIGKVETQGASGRILMEGAVALPALRLLVQHNRHAILARHLLEILGEGVNIEPQPVVVPDTGETLSAREVEVLRLLAAEASNGEVTETLILSIHTVKRHMANILAKLNVTSRTQAAARARDLGLIPVVIRDA